jgi:alanine dehydrogenase
MKTHLINKELIKQTFDVFDYVRAVKESFRIYGNEPVQMPPKVYLSFPEGDMRCMPIYLPTENIAGVKNVNVHPKNKDHPTVMGTITLFDPETGFPLVMMDGTHITNMRTGASGAVAAKYLSNKSAGIVAFIGAGTQSLTQLESLLTVRDIELVKVYDVDDARSEHFMDVASKYDLQIIKSDSINAALYGADIVTIVTPSREPLVMYDQLSKGVHINAIGADAKGKQELDPEILKHSRVVIDNWEQASHSGEINVALSQGYITRDDIYADIGEIVTRRKLGRESLNDTTVFDSTGLAIQDIYTANEIYKRIKEEHIDLPGFEFF